MKNISFELGWKRSSILTLSGLFFLGSFFFTPSSMREASHDSVSLSVLRSGKPARHSATLEIRGNGGRGSKVEAGEKITPDNFHEMINGATMGGFDPFAKKVAQRNLEDYVMNLKFGNGSEMIAFANEKLADNSAWVVGMQYMLFDRVAKEHPVEVMNIGLSGGLDFDEVGFPLRVLVDAGLEVDGNATVAFVENGLAGEAQARAYEALASGLARNDFSRALGLAERVDSESARSRMVSAAARGLTETDRNAAMAELSGDPSPEVARALRTAIGMNYADEKPEKAFEFFQTFPEDERSDVMNYAIRVWSDWDPEGLASYVCAGGRENMGAEVLPGMG